MKKRILLQQAPLVVADLTPEQLELIRRWIEENPEHPGASTVCTNLITKNCTEESEPIVFDWCLKHVNAHSTGDVLWVLVACSKTDKSIQLAKTWLEHFPDCEAARQVTNALIGAGDEEFVQTTKKRLSSGFTTDDYTTLLCLLHGCPDEETFVLTRAFIRFIDRSRSKPYPWELPPPDNFAVTNSGGYQMNRINISVPMMLNNLLYLDSAGASSDLAYELPEMWIGSPIEGMILLNLHKNERNKEITVAQTRKWLDQNQEHKLAPALSELLLE